MIILTLVLDFTSNAQTSEPISDSVSEEIKFYDYRTTLKGGYTIIFTVDDTLEYLHLKKGSLNREISACSRGLPYKNLGYVGADFDDYFVLVHSYGSANPHYIELIKKASAQDVLKRGGAWIDASEEKSILLYSEFDVPAKGDSMTLRNIKTGTEKKYRFPDELFDGPEALNRIKIKSINTKKLTIAFSTYVNRDKDLIKMYSR